MRDFAVPKTPRFEDAAGDGPKRLAGVRDVLGDLFPPPARAPSRAPGRRLVAVVAQVVAVGLGTALLLERVPGVPSWDTVYGEDYWKFLTQALQQPWHVFIPYGGYDELVPRLIAQFATYLPLAQASRLFAVSGALIASGCGLFIFHASAGHIRSVPLRVLLGSAVVLMPIALMEIVDSAVGSPWYLLLATFWALLWRPQTPRGMAVAALAAFAATSSEILNVLFVPLVVARLFVLRHPREHAVTAGWLAGCLLQLPEVVSSYLAGQSRLSQPGTVGHSLAFYAHDIVLPSLGWHLAWRLQSLAGRNGATVVIGVALTVIIGAILVTQPGNRPFVVTALLTGFVFSVFSTTLNPHVATYPVLPYLESGSRYSVLPIFLIESIAIVGVDYLIRQRSGLHRRRGTTLRPAIAVSALIAVLAASWVADFRYPTFRSRADWNWGPIAAKWQHDCEHSQSGQIVERAGAYYQALPCDRIRP